jgi:hypothetical protein
MWTIDTGEKQANESDSFEGRRRLIWIDTYERLIRKQRMGGEESVDFLYQSQLKNHMKNRGEHVDPNSELLEAGQHNLKKSIAKLYVGHPSAHDRLNFSNVTGISDNHCEPGRSFNLLLIRIIKRIFGFASTIQQNSC